MWTEGFQQRGGAETVDEEVVAARVGGRGGEEVEELETAGLSGFSEG